MEKSQRTCNHEDEVRGLCVNMDNEGMKYNGHGEGKE